LGYNQNGYLLDKEMQLMRKLLLALLIALLILPAAALPARAAVNREVIDAAARDTAAYLIKATPKPALGAVGGEWLMIGLARSGFDLPPGYTDDYLKRVQDQVKKNRGLLHERKYSEYARLILALTALSRDPAAYGGYNLLLPLADYDKTVWQGINGAIFALLALDCGNYTIPRNKQANTQATRDKYVQYILSCELAGGGFSLSGAAADPDLTAMALQALAKYQEEAAVAEVINRALRRLSALQDKNGGYSSWSASNCESVAQVIVALTELGISPQDDRFIKNGQTLADNLLGFYAKGKGFAHGVAGSGNMMASEQALYALVSWLRFEDGQSGLYRMAEDNKAEGAAIKVLPRPPAKKVGK
jgi:hypothetical protein